MADLIADPALQVAACTSHCQRPDRQISWVATTELPDPAPFLRGGELVMTTGILPRDDAGWVDLVDRLASVPVAGLCFGIGLVHRQVPAVVAEHAEAAGLALVSSPRQVPFVRISRWVADRIFAEQYAATRAAVVVQDELIGELVSGGGLRGLLRRLHRHLGAGEVAVVEPGGRVLTVHPARSGWVAGARIGLPAGAPDPEDAQELPTARPITVEGVPVAYLCTRRPARQQDLLSFAATVVGLELARQQAVRTGRRELLGQLLEDVVAGTVSEHDARRRLPAHGLAPEGVHSVVVARVAAAPDRVRRLPWSLGPLLQQDGDRLPTALLDDAVVVVVPGDVDAEATAEAVRDHLAVLDPQVRVGVGAARRGVPGLRSSYFEARQAARSGTGVHRAQPLSITGLLLGNLDLPLHELGASVLAPLLQHDAAHRAELVATLRSYLAHDCNVAATAHDLVLHRNSLRYRLQLIQQLTGRDLGRLPDRMELWLALGAMDLGGGSVG